MDCPPHGITKLKKKTLPGLVTVIYCGVHGDIGDVSRSRLPTALTAEPERQIPACRPPPGDSVLVNGDGRVSASAARAARESKSPIERRMT